MATLRTTGAALLLAASVAVARPVAGQATPGTGAVTSAPLDLSGSTATMPHGGHGRFSSYLIDPLFTHHAILEGELRVTSTLDRRKGGGSVWGTSLEVAYVVTDAFGIEIFVPLLRGRAPGDRTNTGMGDLEVQPLKWSFYRTPNLLLTAVLGGVIPQGMKRWTAAAACGPSSPTSSRTGSSVEPPCRPTWSTALWRQEMEFSSSAARTFSFGDDRRAGPLIELIGTRITRGDEAGTWEELGIAPGSKLQVIVATGGYHVSF